MHQLANRGFIPIRTIHVDCMLAIANPLGCFCDTFFFNKGKNLFSDFYPNDFKSVNQ